METHVSQATTLYKYLRHPYSNKLPFPVLGSLAAFLGLQATVLPVPGTVLGGVSAEVARFF